MTKAIQIIASAAILLFLSISAMAQTAGLMPMAVQQFFDANGNPLASGTVTTYVVGSTTFKTTWRDSSETIPNTNPIVLDAGGKAIIYGDGNYRQLVKDRNGNIIWDAVTSAFGTGGATQIGDGTAVGTVLPWSGLIAPTRYVFAYGQELSRTTYSFLYSAIILSTSVVCTNGSPILTGLSDTSQIPIGLPVEATCIAAGSLVTAKTGSTVTVSNNASITVSTTARFFPWGNGNGTTTFNVPDLRGRVIAGRDNLGGTAASRLTTFFNANGGSGLGLSGGGQSSTLISSNLPAYTPAGTIISTQVAHSHALFANTSASGGTPSISNQAAVQGTDYVIQGTNTAATLGLSATATPSITSTFTGTAQGGTSSAFANVQPTLMFNYIIKILPDINISTLNVVTSLGGMIGDITCSGLVVCSGQNISVAGAGSGDVIGPGSAVNNNLASYNLTTGKIIKDSLIQSTGNGGAYFKDGYPWADVRAYGAVGDCTASDSAAFQAAYDAMVALNGSTVYIPSGFYCFDVKVTANSTGVNFLGSGLSFPVISANGNDITLFDLSNGTTNLTSLQLIGKGANSDAGTFGATQPTVILGSNCIKCNFTDVTITGGAPPISWTSSEAYLTRVDITQSYSSALVYIGNGGGGWINRAKLDSNWVTGAPAYGTAFNAWAATTVYATGVVVSRSGYYIQALTGGTSGGSAPTLRNYGLPITDGSVTWKLLSPVTFYALQMDTGASEIYGLQIDMTGPAVAGFAMTNTLSGTAPQYFKCDQCIVGQTYDYGILANNGSNLYLTDMTVGNCIHTNCKGILFNTTWTGNSSIAGGQISTGSSIGISVAGGSYNIVQGVNLNNNTIAGISAEAGVSNFVWNGNTSYNNTLGFQVKTGVSDYYNIVSNICGSFGSCISDQGTGTHKNILNNDSNVNSLAGDTIVKGSLAVGNVASQTAQLQTTGTVRFEALTSGCLQANSNGTLSTSGGCGTFFTPETYGALHNGIFDDRVAVQAAIAAAQSAAGGTGGAVYLANVYSISDDGAGCGVTVSSRVNIIGPGWISPFNTFSASADILCINSAAGATNNSAFNGFTIGAVSGSTIGRNGIYINTTGANQFLSNTVFDHLNILPVNGRSFKHENSPGANVNGGFFTSTISNSLLTDGIYLVSTGDSLNILNNTMYRTNAGIQYSMVAGAARLQIRGNNITSPGGSIVCNGGAQVSIVGNQMELAGSGSNFAQVDFNGTTSNCVDSVIKDNNFNISTSNATSMVAHILVASGSTGNSAYGNVFSTTNTNLLASGHIITNNSSSFTIGRQTDIASTYSGGNYAGSGTNFYNDMVGAGTFLGSGGTSKVLMQTSAGAAITVARLACSDLSDASSGCSATSGITALTGNITATGPGLAVATIANNAVTLAKLATQASNTVLGNATSGTAVPTALAVGSCSTAASALIWTTNTGFGCNTSITAAAVPIGGITGLGTGVATFLATPSSANLAAAVTDETGSGALVFATSPTLVTPTLGVASATSINKVAITAPATSSILTIANNKTFTASNTLTLTGVDGSSLDVGAGGTLGTAAFATTGVSGHTVPFLDGGLTLSGNNTYSGTSLFQQTVTVQAAVARAFFIGSTQADFFLEHTSAGSDLKNFQIETDSGVLSLRGLTDALATKYNFITMSLVDGSTRMPGTVTSTSKTTGNLINSGGFGNAGAIFTDTLSVITMAADTATVDTTVCRVAASGLLLTGTGTLGICLGTPSIRASKRDIIQVQDGLEQINRLQPKNFFYRAGYGNSSREQYGFIAEEFFEVLPKLTHTDANGNPLTIDILGMTPIMVRAIQQLKSENDNLRITNDNFEMRLQALEGKK